MFEKFLVKFFPDSKVTSFWQNKIKRSILLLIFWFIFISLIILFTKHLSNKYPVKEEKLLSSTLKETLVLDNFEFIYKKEEVSYSGKYFDNEAIYSKLENDIETDYYLTNGEILVKGENNYLFLEKVNEKNIYDLKYLLNNMEVVSEKENEINFKIDDIYGIIKYVDETNIDVVYKLNEIEYRLNISNINKIDSLDIK